MKRTFVFLMIIVIITSFGCTKRNDSTTPATVTSTWTFDGKTYNVTGASMNSSDVLIANDDPGVAGGGNYVRIIFGAITRPSASATLTVNNSLQPDPTTCIVQAGNVYDPIRPLGYISTGKAGDKVILTVLSSGKLSVSFSNVTVSDYLTTPTTKTVSGTIVEQ